MAKPISNDGLKLIESLTHFFKLQGHHFPALMGERAAKHVLKQFNGEKLYFSYNESVELRNKKIFQLHAAGMPFREIADRAGLSPSTVHELIKNSKLED